MRQMILIMLMLSLMVHVGDAAAQTVGEDSLKSVVLNETRAYYAHSWESWQSTWLHDESVTKTVVGYGTNTSLSGWEKMAAAIAKTIKSAGEPVPVDVAIASFNIRRGADFAWVEYIQTLTSRAAPDQTRVSREQRVLVRDAGTWKIAAEVTHITSSYENTPAAIESRINSTGYALLDTGKTQAAIDLLKVNVQLYPESWNAYDSLGEAYAASGEKSLAIQNYERSIALNPKNESGKAALDKLKTK